MSDHHHDLPTAGPPTKRRRTRSPSPETAVAMAEAKRQAENEAMDVDEEFEFDEDDEGCGDDEFGQDVQGSVERGTDDDDEDDLHFEDISLPPAPRYDAQPRDDSHGDKDEDDDELEFEDIDIPSADLSRTSSEPSIPITTNLSTIEFTLPLNPDDSQASSTSQKKRRAITKADRIARLTLHRMHLLSLLASAHLAHRASYEDETVHALALSLIPPHVATSMRLGSDHVRLGPLMTWLRSEFTADPMLPWPDGAETVAPAIANRVGHPCTLVLAVAALLWHVVGVKARLVAGLNPIPLTFQGQSSQNSSQDSTDFSQSSTTASSSSATKSSREVLVQKAATVYPLAFALEVPKGHGEWTPLHFNWTIIDHMAPTTTSAYTRAAGSRSSRPPAVSDSQPHPFDALKSSGGPHFTSPYVLALTNPPRLSRASIPRAKDVSVRYLTGRRGGRPVEDPKFRVPLDDAWLSRIVSTGAGDTVAGAASSVEDQYMLEQLLVNAPFPTRLADYKDHRVYALERHLRKDEVVYPKELVLGKIKGEMIYPRANVKLARSERVWVRQFGRQVKAGETPVKESKARVGKGNGGDEEKESQGNEGGGNGGGVVGLFGEWQTEPYVSTAEVNPVTGEVPTNEYGNVELFHPCMIPRGGVHVTVPNAKRIAKDLAIPFAEAMTGFDFASGGRTRPTIHGIVVAAHAASIIKEAATNLAAAHHEQELASRKHQIAMRWVMFAKGLVAREQVKRLFARTGARPAAEAPTSIRGSVDRDAAGSDEDDSDLEVVGPRLRRRRTGQHPTAVVDDSDASSGSGDDDVAHPEAGGFGVSSASESQASGSAADSDAQESESEEEWDDRDLGPRARRQRSIRPRPSVGRIAGALLPPGFEEGGGGFM